MARSIVPIVQPGPSVHDSDGIGSRPGLRPAPALVRSGVSLGGSSGLGVRGAEVIVATMDRVCGLVWISGTAVIVASWLDVVTPAVGWIGFTVALAGSMLSSSLRTRKRSAARAEVASSEPDA
jgi:hypothetical protein